MLMLFTLCFSVLLSFKRLFLLNKMWHNHTMEYYASIKRNEEFTITCMNIEHYAKGKKPVIKHSILYDSTEMKYLE